MRRFLIALFAAVMLFVVGAAISRSGRQREVSRIAAGVRHQRYLDKLRAETVRDSIRLVEASAPISVSPEFERTCKMAISVARQSGALVRFGPSGRDMASAVVGGPWHSMTFDEKELLAVAISYRCRLSDGGSVMFRGLYTDHVLAAYVGSELHVY
jgi:hypothetical protein